VVDLSNLFQRARYGATADPDTKAGLAILIIFRSLRKLYRDLRVDHMVFAVDRGSWRPSIYPAYKARRRLLRMTATAREQEEEAKFFAVFDALLTYLSCHTRCTILAAPEIEADDFIARWIVHRPQDEHVIVSGDSDFVQLINHNVRLYDAMFQRMLSVDGVFDEQGLRLSFTVSPKNGKIKVGAIDAEFVPEPEWWRKALFLKLVRGDVTDSVFAAYPGVRYEGKKISIRAAWADRDEQGYDWNNLMFQSWDKLLESGAVERVRVIDQFRINEQIIDLTQQPSHIKQRMDAAIDTALAGPVVRDVGVGFLKFCAAHDLPALVKEASDHVSYLNAPCP
jgi:5'-3' exonuclease